MGVCKTRKELAAEYGVDPKTFYRWLKRRQIHLPQGIVSPRQIDIIYHAFGRPDSLDTYSISFGGYNATADIVEDQNNAVDMNERSAKQ